MLAYVVESHVLFWCVKMIKMKKGSRDFEIRKNYFSIFLEIPIGAAFFEKSTCVVNGLCPINRGCLDKQIEKAPCDERGAFWFWV